MDGEMYKNCISEMYKNWSLVWILWRNPNSLGCPVASACIEIPCVGAVLVTRVQ
jgi:hypothetical protein